MPHIAPYMCIFRHIRRLFAIYGAIYGKKATIYGTIYGCWTPYMAPYRVVGRLIWLHIGLLNAIYCAKYVPYTCHICSIYLPYIFIWYNICAIYANFPTGSIRVLHTGKSSPSLMPLTARRLPRNKQHQAWQQSSEAVAERGIKHVILSWWTAFRLRPIDEVNLS